MKINKKHLVLRIITSPIKLLFTIFWFQLVGFMIFLKWLKNGGQELYYGDLFGGSLVTLIESNKELVKSLKKQEIDQDKINQIEVKL